jgi:type I restriction enzyme M protein
VAQHLNSYIAGFSDNVQHIFERFGFDVHVARMNEKNILYMVVKQFAGLDLSPAVVDNIQMGYVFEELIRIGAEQSNEEAGEHFTPREVIQLMVSLLLAEANDISTPGKVHTIFDPACGTGGMLTEAKSYILAHNDSAHPRLYGQELNDEAWAVCQADMLIKEEDGRVVLGDSLTQDGFIETSSESPNTFDFMLANPPFGVEWKQQETKIRDEHNALGERGRFGAGLPSISDGALLFLQHMISKMRPVGRGGSRIAIIFNGSPLFTGDAGGGESNIRRWIIENDWLEAVVALPEQLFYNTGIATYIWILSNRKSPNRKGLVQLIDARQAWLPMAKSLGNKRRRIGGYDDGPDRNHIEQITKLYGAIGHDQSITVPSGAAEQARVVSKTFRNEDFGYYKITVERPLRLRFEITPEGLLALETLPAFIKLSTDRKEAVRAALSELITRRPGMRWMSRETFLENLDEAATATSAKLRAPERKAIVQALGQRDPAAEICLKDGEPEADADLRDTETVPLTEDVEAYFVREVLPHVPDAWVDRDKTKIGYEIPFNRHFYVYEPPRPLEAIAADLKALEAEIVQLLQEVTA